MLFFPITARVVALELDRRDIKTGGARGEVRVNAAIVYFRTNEFTCNLLLPDPPRRSLTVKLSLSSQKMPRGSPRLVLLGLLVYDNARSCSHQFVTTGSLAEITMIMHCAVHHPLSPPSRGQKKLPQGHTHSPKRHQPPRLVHDGAVIILGNLHEELSHFVNALSDRFRPSI
ncbi:unnamed protein product [Schistocephalus solidus]|uniref:Uncharacterized protein n=1 Tax=Schistocephalus solidus TaxID=70667 RepID=A0A183T475_SCHSO|nr:unnamed protein product [Schistocephalus solidus]